YTLSLHDALPIYRAENFVSKFEGPNFGAAQIVNINSCHRKFPNLRLLGRTFRSLQRIDRCRSGETTTLSRWLLCLGNHQISTIRAGHAAFYYQQVVVFVHAQHAQVAHSDPLDAHVSGHSHSLEHSRWKCG